MDPKNYDWSRFSKQIYIKAAREEIFRAWAIPAGIVRFFIAQAEYTTPQGEHRGADELIRAGDRYHWRFNQPLEMRGEILQVIPNELLQFTFGDLEDGSHILVTIRFYAGDGETLLELTQENIPTDPEGQVTWHLSCNQGWGFYLTNLKAVLEYGADLREPEQERAGVARAVTH